jgi:nicotinamide-nucleotide amidase
MSLAKEIIELLAGKKLKLAIAESLTGGLLSSELVSVAGASEVVLGTVVAYQTGLKSTLLGVNSELLEANGAVDPEVATQMAEGIRSRLSLQLLLPTEQILGIATTGVAGPDEQDGQPVGTVYLAISGTKGPKVWAHVFTGNRNQIRQQSVEATFEHIREYFAK